MFVNIFAVLGSILLNVTAQLLIRKGMLIIGEIGISLKDLVKLISTVFFSPFILAAIFCYGISIVLWMIALSRISVSIAYPFQSIGYIITCFAGWYFFSEPISISKLGAIAVICIGVIWLVSVGTNE